MRQRLELDWHEKRKKRVSKLPVLIEKAASMLRVERKAGKKHASNEFAGDGTEFALSVIYPAACVQ